MTNTSSGNNLGLFNSSGLSRPIGAYLVLSPPKIWKPKHNARQEEGNLMAAQHKQEGSVKGYTVNAVLAQV
jgi:hypothetical protein